MNQNNKNHGRVELKNLFKNGNIPSENDFNFLIDSTINKQDDGFSKNVEEGFVIAATNTSEKLITFYNNPDEMDPSFSIDVINKGAALKISPFTQDNNKDIKEENTAHNDNTGFFFHKEGKLGIGKLTDKNYVLDVNGFAASKGRIGTFKCGSVPADGKWHAVIKDLDNCQAFELIARTGLVQTGLFAILHAIALSAFGGKSKSKITKTSACYGFYWNKISVKWTGTTHNYSLMLRTNRNYGKDANGKDVSIFYNITKLWDDENFMPEAYFYNEQ